MKKELILLAAAGLIISSVIGYPVVASSSKAEGAPSTSTPASSPKIITVNELAAHPTAFQGNIILRGVVAGINRSQKILGVIDVAEFKNCGTLLCARYTLPVKYTGKPPELKSLVNISGRLIKNSRGLIFEAKSIQVTK